jgi:acetylornithine deacetylase/succinyl-diaminopimelate desuccinylase-like protein
MTFDPVEKLKEFVRHASISTDSTAKAGMQGAQEFLAGLLGSLGFAVEVVRTAKHPIILAAREPATGATGATGATAASDGVGDGASDGDGRRVPHVVIYGHYDVQPADPLGLWKTPPFDPVVRDGRIWGRGAADNKGPLMTHIAGVARLLERRPDLPLRITFMIEGEEEMGSPSFPKFLNDYRDRLKKADLVLLSDTGSPSAEQIVITCGLRGLVLCDVEVTGPQTDLHSGLHGGVLRNPIQAVAELCASLHTPDGRVNIPGFYDDVLDVEPWEREELEKLGGDEEAYRKFLGIPAFHPTAGYTPFECTRYLPTLEFNGIGGGYQGEGTKTVIPGKAFVKISCRLVANQQPERIRELLYKTIRERMPADVTYRIIDQHGGTPYVVVPPDRSNTPSGQSPVLARAFRSADAAIAEAFGKPPLYLREGGSVPIIADIRRELGLDSVMVGLFLPQDNLHAPNESFDLGVMEHGIRASARILEGIATVD